jgi:hypothetical protein
VGFAHVFGGRSAESTFQRGDSFEAVDVVERDSVKPSGFQDAVVLAVPGVALHGSANFKLENVLRGEGRVANEAAQVIQESMVVEVQERRGVEAQAV